MKPIAIAALAAALLVLVGSFALPWFTAQKGSATLTITGRGVATQCTDGAPCVTRSTDGLGYDSTWLGLVGAIKIAAGLGVIACGGAAAMAQAKRTRLGDGGTAIKKGHVAFAMLVGGGISCAALVMKPGDVQFAAGAVVALVGYLVGIVALATIKDGVPKAEVATT